jgi:hypothetical protein
VIDLTDWTILGVGFAGVGGAIGHLYTRIATIAELAHSNALAGDRDLWSAMEKRHAENLTALHDLRTESREAHKAIFDKVDDLRAGIDTDRRQATDRLFAEIQSLRKGNAL